MFPVFIPFRTRFLSILLSEARVTENTSMYLVNNFGVSIYLIIILEILRRLHLAVQLLVLYQLCMNSLSRLKAAIFTSLLRPISQPPVQGY